jgi:hypothetical protein
MTERNGIQSAKLKQKNSVYPVKVDWPRSGQAMELFDQPETPEPSIPPAQRHNTVHRS